MALLGNLPPELLDQIVTYLPTASSVNHLAQTSRPLHRFIEKEGWRAFAQTRFPSYSFPPVWQDSVHSLTTLSRNWDRRAFIARYIEPSGDVKSLPEGKQLKQWQRPRGQTMGFQPAIDSHEQFSGGKWDDRRQVLAWSAGAELVVRIQARKEAKSRDGDKGQRKSGSRVEWWTYKPLSAVEGRDDITSVNILKGPAMQRTPVCQAAQGDQIILGTANCDLQLVEISTAPSINVVKTYYVTNGRSVRSATVSDPATGRDQRLAANLSDNRIVLYPIDADVGKIAPISDINAIPQARKGCRIWSTKFLNQTHLAVGLGPSVEPVHVFEVRPDGLHDRPIRKFGLTSDMDGRLDDLGTLKPSSSIYPIEPLCAPNGGPGDGNIFLSGGYDGVIRLHDMRSRSPVETTYRDPTDDSAIYSLLTRGQVRIVAGAARHSLLKIFDLRMTNASDYDYLDSLPTAASMSAEDISDESRTSEGDWNVFINPRDRYANASWRGPNSWMRQSAESSVYSLSSPSSTSPFVFAGVVNAVVEFNFSSVLDRHPDPLFTPSHQKSRRKKQPSRHQDTSTGQVTHPVWGDESEVLNLAMYTQSNEGAKDAMQLRTQRSIPETLRERKRAAGLDERWKIASDAGNQGL